MLINTFAAEITWERCTQLFSLRVLDIMFPKLGIREKVMDDPWIKIQGFAAASRLLCSQELD